MSTAQDDFFQENFLSNFPELTEAIQRYVADQQQTHLSYRQPAVRVGLLKLEGPPSGAPLVDL